MVASQPITLWDGLADLRTRPTGDPNRLHGSGELCYGGRRGYENRAEPEAPVEQALLMWLIGAFY